MGRWCKKLQVSSERIGEELVLSRAGRKVWEHISSLSQAHVWKVFESKLLHIDDLDIADFREARGLEEYTVLIPQRFKDILDRYTKSQEDANAEVQELEAVLRDFRVPLCKIFQYYWLVLQPRPHTGLHLTASALQCLWRWYVHQYYDRERVLVAATRCPGGERGPWRQQVGTAGPHIYQSQPNSWPPRRPRHPRWVRARGLGR